MALTKPCTNCGGELLFSPGSSSLSCPYCGALQTISQDSENHEHTQELDYQSYLAKVADSTETISATTTSCSGCSAHLTLAAEKISQQCPYCGSPIVLSDKQTRQIIPPKGIVPFHIRARKAQESYQGWVKKRWFAPNDFKRYAMTNDQLSGVYIPYWTFDAHTISSYQGRRGNVHGSGKNRRVSWNSVSGVVVKDFDDVLVVASVSLPHTYVDRLEPWNLSLLEPFSVDYLRGFQAEQYQIELPGGFTEAQSKMEQTIHRLIKQDIGGDRQEITSSDTQYSNVTFKHILLPIWVTAYRYKEKVYRMVINGTTGEVQGERPWSMVKIAFSSAVAFGVALFMIIAGNQ